VNFDYGNMLGRAWQITWKHKAIWALLVLPMSLSFLFIPFFIAPLFFLDEGISSRTETVFLIAMFVFLIIFMASSLVINTISMSSATLGVIRAERGEGSLSFIDLLRDGTEHFGRILGATLIISLTIGLGFFVFFMCVLVLSVVTMGLASICLQPVMILLTPLMFLMIGVMEAAQTAVIAESLNPMDAVKRALQVVRENIWKYVLITLIVYFGSSILSSFLMLPIMIPIFAVPFFLESGQNMSQGTMISIAAAFSCIFFPLMLAFQSIVGTFMKTSLDITYLRLTHPTENRVISDEIKPLKSNHE
jgi:hypothetical protein